MKRRDVVRLFEHSVMIEFGFSGETGSISTVQLDKGVRFVCADDAIHVSFFHAPQSSIIERFASTALAKAGYERLQSVVRQYVYLRRMKNILKKLVIWGALPFIALVVVASMNIALTRGLVPTAQALPSSLAPSAAATLPVSPSTESGPALPSQAELAKAMADGAAAGRYSILRGAGKKAPIYVFSDPLCDYCRRLEPELEKLGRDHTIHIFPVSVIGGQQSLARLNKLMCNKAEVRDALWKEVIAGSIPQGSSCADGDAAIEANNKIFAAMGFAGTPTIISSNGEQVAEFESAASIENWLNRRAMQR